VRLLLAAEDVVPDSKDIAVEDVVEALDSVEALDFVIVLDSVEALEFEMALDCVKVLDSEMVLDSVEAALVVPNSVNMVANSVEMVPDSVDMVADSVESLCARCGTFHAGGVFREACFQARRHARRCARYGLLHEDYDMPARWLDDMEKFDCEFYIPDVEKLQMDGNTIILPEQVIKKLEEHIEKKQTNISKVHAFNLRYMHLLICFF
jgi:hypothetical protein